MMTFNGKAGSLTTVTGSVGRGAATLAVASTALIPAVPCFMVLFNSTDYTDPADDPFAEVIKVNNKDDASLVAIERGQEGTRDQDHTTSLKTYKLAPAKRFATEGTAAANSDFGANGLAADVVAESTPAAGVTADGVLLKDGAVTATGDVDTAGTAKADTITEHTAAAGVTVDGVLVKDGVVTESEAVASIAAAGDGMDGSSATLLTAKVNLITGADGTKGVRLPAATVGKEIWGQNSANAQLLCWPATGETINGLSANIGVTILNNSSFIARCVGTGKWALVFESEAS